MNLFHQVIFLFKLNCVRTSKQTSSYVFSCSNTFVSFLFSFVEQFLFSLFWQNLFVFLWLGCAQRTMWPSVNLQVTSDSLRRIGNTFVCHSKNAFCCSKLKNLLILYAELWGTTIRISIFKQWMGGFDFHVISASFLVYCLKLIKKLI